MKNIVILGSTGSIGAQTLEVVRRNKKHFRAIGLSGHKNEKLLRKQVKEFRPEDFCLTSKDGDKSLLRLATHKKADLIVNGLVGKIGLAPTFAAIRAGKHVAIADKEALIHGGKKLLAEAKKHRVNFIPVDSEHTPIWLALQKYPHKKISKIILTCSGGPFYKTPIRALKNITPEQALKHPRWHMGKKVTIDSATMMNKGFELIECCILYGVKPEQIEIIYHPESIVHSAVIFMDGSVFIGISKPDMKIPITYALFYPDAPPRHFPQPSLRNLTFKKINDKFNALKICRFAASQNSAFQRKLAQADEETVAKFLDGKIKFLEIVKSINKAIWGRKKNQ